MDLSSGQSVSLLSILCMFVSVLVCFGLPIGLAVWAKRKYGRAFSLLPLLGGALGFFVSQIVFRIPVMQYVLPLFGWYQKLKNTAWPYAIFLALTAGLVEEPARFIVYTIMKKRRKFPDGFSYGIGHGGTEAILLAGLPVISSIVFSVMINAGIWDKWISSLPATTYSSLYTTGQGLAAAAPATFLIGGAERVFAISIQIALSLVVIKGFMTNRKWLYLAIAILLHALIDFPAALFSLNIIKMNILSLEGIVFAEAIAAVFYIVWQALAWHRSTQKAAEPAAT